MDPMEIIKRTQRLLADNSPVILTALGVTGTLVTAYLAGTASFQAAHILAEESPHLTTKEKTKLVWKLYIPTGLSAAATVGAVIAANQVQNRRTAAMATMYAVTQRAYDEYRDKIRDKLGPKKEQAARVELAQEKVDKVPQISREVFLTGAGDILCFEDFTGRFFESDQEALRKAQNDVNQQVLNDGYASLTDFYDRVNLPRTAHSDEVGWTADNLLDLTFDAVLTDRGQGTRPCMVMSYRVMPARHFSRFV